MITFLSRAACTTAAFCVCLCLCLWSSALAQDEFSKSVTNDVSTTEVDPSVAVTSPWQSIAIYPPAIRLSAKTDSQHVIAVATRSDGISLDVTEQVVWSLENPEMAQFEGTVLSPIADGSSQITAQWQGLSARADLQITNSQMLRSVSFERDVMPILTTVGCNTGSCHGAARGKDGFRLSLFGACPSHASHDKTL